MPQSELEEHKEQSTEDQQQFKEDYAHKSETGKESTPALSAGTIYRLSIKYQLFSSTLFISK